MSAPIPHRINDLIDLNRKQPLSEGEATSFLYDGLKHQVDFLSIAVLVNDVKEPVTLLGLNIGAGDLIVPDDTSIAKRPPLTEHQLVSVEYGGGGNVALPAAALGISTGVMGYAGKDVEGTHFVMGMQQYGVNTFGIIRNRGLRTDVSFKN